MSRQIQFAKYQGTGNDFILIDGRTQESFSLTEQEIVAMCDRRFGIGADGLIILRNKLNYDFYMDFYNSDGKPGSMCGNGGRCITAFAHDLGIIGEKANFWAPDGEHQAIFNSHKHIALQLHEVTRIEYHEKGTFLNTGSPHLVIFKENNDFDTYSDGKAIRYSDTYRKEGTNVNFFQIEGRTIKVSTYERGVEDVTLSCGTGTVASAISAFITKNMLSPVTVKTAGGQLTVRFNAINHEKFTDIWLEGPAHKAFEGIYYSD